MANKTGIRELIFFVIMWLSFWLAVKGQQWLDKNYNWNKNLIIFLVGLLFTGVMAAIYYGAKMNTIQDNYRMLEISPGARCKGGPYMWQGDSNQAKECRAMAKTKSGRCEIAAFQCPNGYHGQPKDNRSWEYTSNSNSCWQQIPCDGCMPPKRHPKPCNCGLCSMVTNELY